MHIVFLSHYFPPEGNAPASRTYEHCKRWVRKGHKVTVITCAPNSPSGIVYHGYKNRLLEREIIDGVDVRRVWTYIAANKGTTRRIANFISYMVSAVLCSLSVRKPDVVIATSPQFFCGWAGVIAGFVRRVPFILEVRDIWPESIRAVGVEQSDCVYRFLEWLESRMYAAARCIVTVGEGYRQRLLEKGVEPEKIRVVMNGVERELFFPREPDTKLARRWDIEDKFVCSYIGTIGMACGLDVVLRAAKILKEKRRNDIVFLLVGDGAVREQLEAEARRLDLKNVIFAGRQEKARIPEYLSISDACLVHLKRIELFHTVMPSKIFEAAGAARPIILGVEGNAADIVKQAGAGMCMQPENEAQLIDGLERLAADPQLARRLGESGFRYVSEHFDRDVLAADYLELIETIGTDTRLRPSLCHGSPQRAGAEPKMLTPGS